MVPNYEFEFCSIRDMTLEQWVELCNAKNVCEEGDFEVILPLQTQPVTKRSFTENFKCSIET